MADVGAGHAAGGRGRVERGQGRCDGSVLTKRLCRGVPPAPVPEEGTVPVVVVLHENDGDAYNQIQVLHENLPAGKAKALAPFFVAWSRRHFACRTAHSHPRILYYSGIRKPHSPNRRVDTHARGEKPSNWQLNRLLKQTASYKTSRALLRILRILCKTLTK